MNPNPSTTLAPPSPSAHGRAASRSRMPMPIWLLVAASLVASLAGCSTTRLVDSDVRTFSMVASFGRDAPYRFERLPSQQAQSQAQGEIEAIAEPALAQVGMVRNDATARYTVQVALQTSRELTVVEPWSAPFGGGFGYGGIYHDRPWRTRGAWAGGFGGFGPDPYFGFPEGVVYHHEVSIQMRELASGKVVYETHASFDDVRAADAAVLRTMFESALLNFPLSSTGVRRVSVEIPR